MVTLGLPALYSGAVILVTKPTAEDRRLVRLTKICLALPEATRECHGSHAAFRVRKKVFAYYLSDHHGDGIIAVTAKVLPGDNVALAAANPVLFYLPAYIASKGWVALRLDVGAVDWEEVAELVIGSYRLIAPRRLAALVGGLPADCISATSAAVRRSYFILSFAPEKSRVLLGLIRSA